MIRVNGVIQGGIGAWRPRMERFRDVFRELTGEYLYPGTLNVRIDSPIAIQADFRIAGSAIGEPEQDMLFERCRVNGIDAFRLRPYQPATGLGGHGDHILELVSARHLRPLLPNTGLVVVEFPRSHQDTVVPGEAEPTHPIDRTNAK